MTSRLWTAAVATLLLSMSPLAASAAIYTVTPVFVGALSPTTFELIPGYDPLNGYQRPAILQFDFRVSVGNFAADQYGFANGVFTITPHPYLTNTTVPGWNPDVIPNVDSNGSTPGGIVPLLSDNADLAAQDLKDILIAVATPLTTNPAVDPRFRFGQGARANFRVGTAFFDYSGQGFVLEDYGVEFVIAKFTQASALYRDGTTNRYIGVVDPFFNVPEPTAAMLAVLGMIGVVQSQRARGR